MSVKDDLRTALDGISGDLIDLSHRIHAHPELRFEEHRAAQWLCEDLASAGFTVERGVGELPTAFVASAGTGELVLAICAEYDALPDIGHACGHNVIAASAVAAGRLLAPVADELGVTVKVLGTPGEEGGGGKILMLQRGAFDGVHAAMMVHPSPEEIEAPTTLAVDHFDVTYLGKNAHASAAPQKGINAADAVTIAQVAIGLLRQHLNVTDRVHGIVTRGGEAPNIIPGRTTASYYVRARTLNELAALRPRIDRCFEAGALATGCELIITETSPPYSEFEHDAAMVARYKTNAEAIGRTFHDPGLPSVRSAGSTDMANVSLALPSIQPMIAIECGDAVNHQPEFAAWCAEPSADRAVLDGGLAMAWTAVDLATDPEQRSRLLARPRS